MRGTGANLSAPAPHWLTRYGNNQDRLIKKVTLLAIYWNIAKTIFDEVMMIPNGTGFEALASLLVSSSICRHSVSSAFLCCRGESRNHASQVIAHTIPMMPLMRKVPRQPTQ